MKHCMGQVKADGEWNRGDLYALPRSPDHCVVYGNEGPTLGLSYGPAFQKMTKITAGPQCNTAVASLLDHRLPR